MHECEPNLALFFRVFFRRGNSTHKNMDRSGEGLTRQDPKSVEIKDASPRHRQSEALPGPQACSEGEDGDSEESSELESK